MSLPKDSQKVFGFIDAISSKSIVGWVWESNPNVFLEIEIHYKGIFLGKTLSNLFRPDLKKAGIGNGNHGFRFDLEGLDPTTFNASHLVVKVPSRDFYFPECSETFGNASDETNLGVSRGFVELLKDNVIYGWAYCSVSSDPVVVEAVVDGVIVANATADMFRVDLLDAGLGDGKKAFQIIIPKSIKSDKEILVRIKKGPNLVYTESATASLHKNRQTALLADSTISDSGNAIENSKEKSSKGSVQNNPSAVKSTGNVALSPELSKNTQLLKGNVSYSYGTISGWVKSTENDKPITIIMEADGNFVWKGLARRRVKLDDNTPDMGDFGYKVLLPEPSSPGRISLRNITIKTEHGQHVPGSPLDVSYPDQFMGFVERIYKSGNVLEVSGWCINLAKLSTSTQVEIIFNDKSYFVSTKGARKDLEVMGFDAPNAEFTIELPSHENIVTPEITVYPGRSGRPLSILHNALETFQLSSANESTGTSTVKSYGNSQDIIEGTIDQVTDRVIRGWARNKNNSECLVVLDCFIDGIMYATSSANRFRPDLAKHFKDHGYHEYVFELTPQAVRLEGLGQIKIEPRTGISEIKHKIETIISPSKQLKSTHTRKIDYLMSFRMKVQSLFKEPPSVAMIVINKNGEELLNSLFNSFSDYNTYERYEIIIIDHGSTDKSQTICESWAKQLNIRWIQRNGNYSFSASNNFGVSVTSSDLLVFVNNDISFLSDTLKQVCYYLANEEIGCVGIKLVDDSPFSRLDMQMAVQHLGVYLNDRDTNYPVLAYEARFTPVWRKLISVPLTVPAVTAAFMACRRIDFVSVGGFDESYFYGQEDVDFCLKIRAMGLSVVSANDLSAAHLRGFSRAKMDKRYASARERNILTLNERFGFWLKRRLSEDRFRQPGFWTGLLPRIAFAVTETKSDTLAGDYFTALELASQLSALFPCTISFVEVLAGTQYQLSDFDVVIAMRDDFDPTRIENAPPHQIKIAWVRNWFERFSEREAAKKFDAIWASSDLACNYLTNQLGRSVSLVPIATNHYKFQAGKVVQSLRSDYCFTGSYWGLNREIVQMLDPAALPFEFALYGQGWSAIPSLAPYARGPLPYSKMPDVYASTRLVIDDANHVTKAWGAVNSRVFDAIAAGCLVVTNGKNGAAELFENQLPTYDTPQELEELLWTYLLDESKRKEKVEALQALVRSRHTYQHRAKTVWSILSQLSANQLRLAIKIGAPNEAQKNEWGDYHFALSMKYEFDKLGHTTRIDCIDRWYNHETIGDDVVIVLRGLTAYKTKSHQINLMWNISHPDKISLSEYASYDHVFVASDLHMRRLQSYLNDRVSVLYQCTDPKIFNPDVPLLDERPHIAFIGNSRGHLRPIIRDAIAANLPVEIYGARWEGLIPDALVKDSYIPNKILGSFYRSADVILNDHWENMREAGFVSNRVFDVLACGGKIISDYVPGLMELFGDAVETYSDGSDLNECVQKLHLESKRKKSERLALAKKVASEHSFSKRVEVLMSYIKIFSDERLKKVMTFGKITH